MIILHSVQKETDFMSLAIFHIRKSLFKPKFYPEIQLLSLVISLFLYGLCATQSKEKIVSYKTGYY